MLLLLLFGMALAWFLQKKLYQKNWQKNLKIQVSFQDSAIYEGEESTLKEVVVNDKLLPIPALELGIFDEPQSGIRPRGKSKREHHRPELQTRCLFVPVSSAGHENTAVSGEKTRILRDHRCACRSVRSFFPGWVFTAITRSRHRCTFTRARSILHGFR